MMFVNRLSQITHWWQPRSLLICNVALVSIVDDDGDEEGDGDAVVISIVVAVADDAVVVVVDVEVPLGVLRLRNCRNVAVVESGSDCSGDGSVMCGVGHNGCGCGCGKGDGNEAIVDGGVNTVGGVCKLLSSW